MVAQFFRAKVRCEGKTHGAQNPYKSNYHEGEREIVAKLSLW